MTSECSSARPIYRAGQTRRTVREDPTAVLEARYVVVGYMVHRCADRDYFCDGIDRAMGMSSDAALTGMPEEGVGGCSSSRVKTERPHHSEAV